MENRKILKLSKIKYRELKSTKIILKLLLRL